MELSKNSKVYVFKKDLDDVKATSKTPTAYARKLLGKVFTLEARLTCSVGGKPSSGKGRANMEVRPSLDQAGVEAICGECFRV